jgi:hypothetical protein
MVTRASAERHELLKRSVACFRAQTYPNRELVVVLDEAAPENVGRIKDQLAGLGAAARIVQRPAKPGSIEEPWSRGSFGRRGVPVGR